MRHKYPALSALRLHGLNSRREGGPGPSDVSVPWGVLLPLSVTGSNFSLVTLELNNSNFSLCRDPSSGGHQIQPSPNLCTLLVEA